MTTTLIVLGHPNRQSFTGAWADATARAASDAGHDVLWSDLYGMGFDAAERAEHYSDQGKSAGFDPLKAQEHAAKGQRLPADVAAEVAKIEQADRIIFHFPIWWFGPPAIVKGWCDRALVHGALHTVDARFDRGRCVGKSALFCVSTGANSEECGPDGKEGDLKLQLWPLAYTLRYLGFSVLEPRTVHGVHGYFVGDESSALEDRLSGILGQQKDVIAGYDSLPRMRFNADDDFDDLGRLRHDSESYSAFIRHPDACDR
ncbi:NAD(P)H-dependent oxidoreductase [Yoonia litorea]|uniref:NAD(P)H dehydrogenase (Quinone) n=1 Tax=Yoonia litorea TaxID=1123755 RepID=A0A1I6LEU5_9RHOB|nr:NAD(P)H-dependent oxidoreductase [Yoonia litorea]SFS01985.1 NAD(P)H dehydrogenase (quinone) [Yoonia litorea]